MSRPILGSVLLASRDAARLRAWYQSVFGVSVDPDGFLRLGAVAMPIDEPDEVAARPPEPARVLLNLHVDDARATADRSTREDRLMATNEEQIRTLVERWAEAVGVGDLDAVLADHSEEIVMFDVPPPYEGVRGLDAYRDTWPPFFEWQAQGASFEIESLDVVAGADVAFAYALLRCGTPADFAANPDIRLRLTLGLRKQDGRWIVAHEHHSFPRTDSSAAAGPERTVTADQELRRLPGGRCAPGTANVDHQGPGGRRPMTDAPSTAHADVGLPEEVSPAEWRASFEAMLTKEKALTAARDEMSAARRRMPMTRVGTGYRFVGPGGEVTLLDLFEGRRQLIVYRFFYAPDVEGWPEGACSGCSMFADSVTHPGHLNARDTTLAFVSAAPQERIETYRDRMGWSVPWYTLVGDDFSRDFDVEEYFGINVFIRDGNDVFRTYFVNGRGVESIGSAFTFLDLTPLGRQEHWEDSPPGRPQGEPYQWWRRHDEYGRS